MKYAVIFDMDGVLIDSNDIWWNAHCEVLKKYGVFLNDTDKKMYRGMSLRNHVSAWNKRFGLSLDLEKFSEASLKIQMEIIKKMKPDKDLINFLKNLKENSVPMGIGTNSRIVRAENILKIFRIRKYFSVIVTASDIEKHKPHPDIFLEVAKKLKYKPENCIVFEDAPEGIEAAKNGKMKSVGYVTKQTDPKELKNADLVIKSFKEVSYSKLNDLMEQMP